MKKFNFRKLGILLAMMLVGGMVLVGSASAFNEKTKLSNDGDYYISSTGNLIFADYMSYSGYAWTVSGNPAEEIGVKVYIYSSGSRVFNSGWKYGYDTNAKEVSGIFDYYPRTLNQPYVRTMLRAYDPDDSGVVDVDGI